MSKDCIKNDLQKLIMQRIAIFDGGMGTTIRSYGLDEIAARGERFVEEGRVRTQVQKNAEEQELFYNTFNSRRLAL